jgi:hypothetical protein
MQIGAPVLRYVRVPWWQSAAIVVPLAAIATLLAFAATVGWLMASIRRSRDRLDEAGRRLRWTARAALLLDLTAVVSAVWLVFWGWPFAALSSPVATSVAVLMYAAAWTAIVLTPFVVWHAHRLRARRPGTRWLRGREYLFVVAHRLLTAICLQWRIAGTTLAF